MHSRKRQLVVLMLSQLVIVQVGWGNPSNKNPDAALAVHGKQVAGALQAKAQSLYEGGNQAVNDFVKAANDNRLPRLAAKPMGQAHVKLVQCRRLARQLKVVGEPAGIDYEFRVAALAAPLNKIIVAWRVLPTSQRTVDQIRRALAKQNQARMKQIQKLKQLASDQKWEQAEKELYETLDLLEAAILFLPNVEQNAIRLPFFEVQSAIESAMSRIRAQQARELLSQRWRETAPDLQGLIAEMHAAADSVASAGTAASGGDLLAGPQLVTAFGERWKETQVAVLRCRALEWVTGSGRGEMAGPEYAGEGQRRSQLETEYASFNQAFYPALARLIEADATRVSGGDAASLYVEYLPALAPLIRRSHNMSLGAAVTPALQKLAARAPQLPNEIAAYDEATSDLLRWRNRVASSRAVAQVAEYPPIEQQFLAATRTEHPYRGLFLEQSANPLEATLTSPAPAVMTRPIQRLEGRQASVVDVVRLPNNGRASIARYRARTYANVPAPLELAAELDALKYDLLVSDQAPPITLLTALSVDSAQRGDLAAVGGTVANLYLESVVTRFAALPVAASVLTPLGALPAERSSQSLLSQMLMRFDLQPHWAQHHHFFVRFAQAGAE